MIPERIFSTWIPLALRFIIRHRRKTIATGGFILTGTTVLVLLYGITTGINDTMVLNTTSLHWGNIFVELPPGSSPKSTVEKIYKNNHVKTVLLRHRLTSLLKTGEHAIPSVIYAVEPEKESGTTAIAKRIIQGSYPSPNEREMLLGSAAAEKLHIKPGGSVSVINSTGGMLGGFTVSGIYQTGISRLDEGISFISAGPLAEELKRKSVSEISVFTLPGTDLTDIKEWLKKQIPSGTKVNTWSELRPDLVQLIEMNRTSAGIIMFIVFALVGFGIGNNFILTIVERFRELGILRAMGMSPRELVWFVFLESFLLCMIAAFSGLIAGWLLTEAASTFGMDLSAFTSYNRYFVASSVIHPRTTISGLLMPAVIALVISAISSFIPARIAAKKVTAETLRYE